MNSEELNDAMKAHIRTITDRVARLESDLYLAKATLTMWRRLAEEQLVLDIPAETREAFEAALEVGKEYYGEHDDE